MAVGFFVLVSLALVIIAGVAVLNTLCFPRLRVGGRPDPKLEGGIVSVLVPARNEAGQIGSTVEHLLAQEGVDFEVLVLDDHSSDGTGKAAQEAGRGDARLRVIAGKALPPGWGGKNWACHQLAGEARGAWLVFTDADVRWSPGALRALIGWGERSRADMLTVWPTQETRTWGERLVVPLMALTVWGYLPVLAVHWIPWPVFSAANGQCLVFRRGAYERVGGHQAARGAIVEDMALAWKIKASGGRLRMADGAGMIACRMYRGWQEVRDGFAKNILAGHGNSLFWLACSTVFHWAVFVAPWLWLGLGWIEHSWPGGLATGWPLWPLALVVLSVGSRALSAAATGQRVMDAVWMPVSVVLMTRIAARAVEWKFRGGPQWKGRIHLG